MKEKATQRDFIYTKSKMFFLLSIIIALFSMATLLNDLFVAFNLSKTNDATQIKEVEDAIIHIKNLEEYLVKIKNEILATKHAQDKIEEEYDKAKELEKLTGPQIEAIRIAINKRATSDKIMGYIWGLLLGVAGSLLASFIYGVIKRKRKSITNK